MTQPDATSPGTETGSDVAAEFGDGEARINRDGSVRKKPGPKPGSRNRPRVKSPTTRPAGSTRPSQAATGVDYRQALYGCSQVIQGAFGLAARLVKREEAKTALQLDGLAVGVHTPAIADALNTTAQNDRRLAAALDKLSTVGPYSLVISVGLGLAFQVAANHGMVGPNEAMGILPAEKLIARAEAMSQ